LKSSGLDDNPEIRLGVGRALPAHAIAEARPRGAERLTILADPNAASFYKRNGAVQIVQMSAGYRAWLPGRAAPLTRRWRRRKPTSSKATGLL